MSLLCLLFTWWYYLHQAAGHRGLCCSCVTAANLHPLHTSVRYCDKDSLCFVLYLAAQSKCTTQCRVKVVLRSLPNSVPGYLSIHLCHIQWINIIMQLKVAQVILFHQIFTNYWKGWCTSLDMACPTVTDNLCTLFNRSTLCQVWSTYQSVFSYSTCVSCYVQ